MIKSVAGAIVFAACFASSSGVAAETWTCTYPRFGGGSPVVDTFRLDGDFLIRPTLQYRVVGETSQGIVAAWSSREGDGVGVMSTVVIINKTTGDFSMSNVRAPALPEDRVVTGTCVRAD